MYLFSNIMKPQLGILLLKASSHVVVVLLVLDVFDLLISRRIELTPKRESASLFSARTIKKSSAKKKSCLRK